MERNQQCYPWDQCWDWCYSACSSMTKLSDWEKSWQVGFRVDKFQAIRQGNTSSNYSYPEAGAILDSSLKSLAQCSAAVKKASKVQGIIRKRAHFCHFTQPERSHNFEYGDLLSTYLEGHGNIRGVQKRATKWKWSRYFTWRY